MILLRCLLFFVVFLIAGDYSAIAQSAAPQWATVKGFLPRWEGADVIVKINNTVAYSGKIRSGMFSYNFQPHGVSEAMLEVKGQSAAHLFFFAEPGVIRVTDDGRRIVATGTAYNDRYLELEKKWDSLAAARNISALTAVKNFKRDLVATLVSEEPSSPLSLRMLYRFYYSEKDVSDTLYHRLFHLLDPVLRTTATGRKIEREVTARYTVAPGRVAPVAMLPDVAKNLHPLYRSGEYTLIHFWASWCHPCTRFNRSLKELDPVSLLTMVGVSLDVNYSAWTHAIGKEELTWKQLSDLKGWKSDVVRSFNVESIPSNILVDPNGIIIARNVSIEELRRLISAPAQKSF